MPNRHRRLETAQAIKNDEFYTQMCDIESECSHYLSQFKGKVIYCNCDTEKSNFVKYFQGLKNAGIIKDIIYSGFNDKWEGLDFRSDEAIKLLKKADIVITNPPFSLFEEYIGLLVR